MANEDYVNVLVTDDWTDSDHVEAALSAVTAEAGEEPEHARHRARFNYAKLLLMISSAAILGALAMNLKHIRARSAGGDRAVGLMTDSQFGSTLSERTNGRPWGQVASDYNAVVRESDTSPDQTLTALNAHVSMAGTREELIDSMRKSAQLALSHGASPSMFDPILLGAPTTGAPTTGAPTTGSCGGVTCEASETCVQNRCKCGDSVLMCTSEEACSGQPPACRLLSLVQPVQTTTALPQPVQTTVATPVITTTSADHDGVTTTSADHDGVTTTTAITAIPDDTTIPVNTTTSGAGGNIVQNLFDGIAEEIR